MPEQPQNAFALTTLYEGSFKARVLDRLIVFLLAVLIIGSPLPFGSVQYFSITAIELLSVLCFLLWILKLATCGDPARLVEFQAMHEEENRTLRQFAFFHRHLWLTRLFRIVTFGRWPRKNVAENLVQEEFQPVPRKTQYFSILGYPVKNTGLEPIGLCFLAIIAVQLIPLPSALLAVLSPTTRDLYRSAASVAETSVAFHTISLDPAATFEKLILYLAYFVIYLVIVNNVRTRTLFSILLYCIFISGVFQGTYGLYEFLSGHQQIFTFKKVTNQDCATGTFINRNHYASYLEMALPLLITVVIGRFAPLRSFRGKFFVRLSHALETQGSQVLLLAMMITLVAVALLFSLSRSGITFGLLSLIVFYFLYWKVRETLTRKALLILTTIGVVALATWIGLHPLMERFLKISENWTEEGARWEVWKDTFVIFLHFPIAGTGAGTFEQVFPMYRSFVLHVVYDYAHNDYLQFLSEMGLMILFLLIAIADRVLSRLRKLLFYSNVTRLSIVQLGAFCSLLSLSLHSVTDFSFQIPAVAVTGCVIAGLFFTHYHAENRGITR